MCAHVCACVRMCAHMCAHLWRMCAHACACVRICARTCVRMRAHVCAHASACVRMRARVCACVRMCARVCAGVHKESLVGGEDICRDKNGSAAQRACSGWRRGRARVVVRCGKGLFSAQCVRFKSLSTKYFTK